MIWMPTGRHQQCVGLWVTQISLGFFFPCSIHQTSCGIPRFAALWTCSSSHQLVLSKECMTVGQSLPMSLYGRVRPTQRSEHQGPGLHDSIWLTDATGFLTFSQQDHRRWHSSECFIYCQHLRFTSFHSVDVHCLSYLVDELWRVDNSKMIRYSSDGLSGSLRSSAE